ncbi:MAG: endonuclease/exonuclease/phosphatase family protein [candidate division KSB1 bacterium]|nr:endonuclease/exonuclease/phosphatase family protein [candidate division KSB1 bacterium]
MKNNRSMQWRGVLMLVMSVFTALYAESAATAQKVRLMTFNVWMAGTNVTYGQNKVLNGILSSGADIVALQETDDAFAKLLAERLHWHYYSSGDNTVLSRFPISATWNAQKAAGAVIKLENNVAIAVQSVHTSAYPYGPYRACLDEADLEDIYKDEEKSSNRVPETVDALNALQPYLAQGPVFMLGDFNSPSHLDWTEAAASLHCDYVVDWPVTSLIAEKGFIDAYRQLYPDPTTHQGVTWSTIYGNYHYSNGKAEPYDRIDYVFYAGAGVQPLDARVFVVGNPAQFPLHRWNEWPSDHAAVVADFAVETGSPVSAKPTAKFYASSAAVIVDETVQFTDISTNSPTSWAWTFQGGDPSQSNEQNPRVIYHAPGLYSVKLVVTNAQGSDTFEVTNLIKVSSVEEPPSIELDKDDYDIEEPITVSFVNGPGNPTDWIGIYKKGDMPMSVWSTLWLYVNGTQSASKGLTDGYVTFTEGLKEAGDYWAGFFENDWYALMDSVAFTVGGGSKVAAKPTVPEGYTLSVSPNPFNPRTFITISLPQSEEISVEIYNLVGKKLFSLFQGKAPAGRIVMPFDASNLSSGIYVCRLTSGQQILSRKMLLLK